MSEKENTQEEESDYTHEYREPKFYGSTVFYELWYPRWAKQKYIAVGLMDARAADDIRISYDFDRDGWIIEQAAVFEWDQDDKECDPEWAEVAFVRAWARERKGGPGK